MSGVSAIPAALTVRGTVHANGAATVANAEVWGVCNHFVWDTTSTDAHGNYLMTFPLSSECQIGDNMDVLARSTQGYFRGYSDTKTFTLQHTVTTVGLNYIVTVISAPEYGPVGMLAAGSLGVGIVLVMRRRQLNTQPVIV